ncbi:0420527c-1c9e-451e-a8ba-68e5bfabf963 [Sclerotinia trifoliorum]|uniref:0420527c-1c9e-451e-a8ba-68e5bfabf963 n=1 Tax=Sclerotinia trifoliorum TaxID=28548 RepID=A0A8H2VU14_9HELO|nr:0420527c-1c9e-451e-a8ba-68e5bfabf963 [Sclerotinia trifoliorum]
MVSFSQKIDSPIDDNFKPSGDSIIPDATVKPVLLEASRPLPNPPVPSRNEVSDYIAKRCNKLEEEENPFDSQFGGGPAKPNLAKTPGGTLLPSIQALQSGSLPGFSNMEGLRSGPLSPNMLAGPKEPADDYFSGDHNMIEGPRGFTPMESALRHERILPSPGNVLSPGNPYSLNSSSLIGGIASPGIGMYSGGIVATPGTADFQRTASEIRQRQVAASLNEQKRDMNITSQPQQMNEGNRNDMTDYPGGDYTAAQSLHMLANQASASSRDSSPHYNIALGQPRQAQTSTQKMLLNRNQQTLNQQMNPMNPMQVNGQMAGRPNNPSIMNGHSMDSRERNNSVNSNSSSPVSNGNSIGYDNDMNGNGSQSMGKKRATTKRKASANKTPPKNNKRTKGGSNASKRDDDMKNEEFTNEDLDNMDDQGDFEENEENNNNNNNNNGKPKKPETDDEKRKSFLERNRVAALKCRQRKKQWLNNLQQKVDTYTNENEALQQRIQQMGHEIIQLRTMLLAHKDTPIGIQQGIAAFVPQIYEEMPQMHQAQNPYGMAGMQPSQNPAMQ